MKDFAGAEEAFRAILRDYPASDAAIPETRLWLGRTLVSLNKADDGIIEFLNVPIMYPKSLHHAEAYAEAARAYDKLGRRDKARRMWGEVLRLQPNGPFAAEAAAFKP